MVKDSISIEHNLALLGTSHEFEAVHYFETAGFRPAQIECLKQGKRQGVPINRLTTLSHSYIDATTMKAILGGQ